MAMTSVRMSEELMEDLQAIAEKLRRSKGWVINDALRQYLEKEAQRERMYQETLKSLQDVQAGRVIDGGRVIDWLDSWGSEQELEPPTL